MSKYNKFLTDNPFRLLKSETSIRMSELSHLERRYTGMVKVGLWEEAESCVKLGSISPEQLRSLVLKLKTNHTERTIYRLFWYYSKDIENHNELSFDEIQYNLLNNSFIDNWLNFIESKNAKALTTALNEWHEITNNSKYISVLTQCLMQDEPIQEEQAKIYVQSAVKQATSLILSDVAELSANEWKNQRTAIALHLIEIVLKSPLDDDLEEMSINRFVPIVNELLAELESIENLYQSKEPEVFSQLTRLSKVIGTRHPVSNQIKYHINKYISSQIRVGISEKSETLTDTNIKNYESDSRIISIDSAPVLFRINGIGLSLIRTAEYEYDKSKSYAIYFFTVFFVPVVPLKRYLVECENNSIFNKHWKFFGKTKFSPYMICHWIVLIIILVLGTITPNQPTAFSDDGGYSVKESAPSKIETGNLSSNAGAELPAMSSNSAVHVPAAESSFERMKRLTEEYKNLESTLTKLKANLDEEKIHLANETERLGRMYRSIDEWSVDTSDQSDVDNFNERVNSYRKQQKRHNIEVSDYNRLVKKFNGMIARQKEILSALKD